MTRKGCGKQLQPGITPARGTCCNPGAVPRGREGQGSATTKIQRPEGQHCQDNTRAA